MGLIPRNPPPPILDSLLRAETTKIGTKSKLYETRFVFLRFSAHCAFPSKKCIWFWAWPQMASFKTKSEQEFPLYLSHPFQEISLYMSIDSGKRLLLSFIKTTTRSKYDFVGFTVCFELSKPLEIPPSNHTNSGSAKNGSNKTCVRYVCV